MRDWSDLPPSWTVASLESLAQINPRVVAFPESDASPVHFVPMRAVTEEFGGIDVSERRTFGKVKKGYTAFQAADVLFAKITPCMENGKLALVPPLDDGVGFGSTEFHVVRAGADLAPKWLAHFLSQAEFRKFARRHMTGTAGQLRVSTSWLLGTRLPVAPAAEQTRIVDKLEELLSHLDAGVAELKAAQKKLAQYRQSLLKAAVEGRLTEAWRAKHGEPEESGTQLLARILRERRARWEAKQLAKFEAQGKAPLKGWQEKYAEPATPNPVEPGELPLGWVWASIEQLTLEQKYGTSAKTDEIDSGVPVIRMGNIQDGELNLVKLKYLPTEHDEFPELFLSDGDLLFNRTNSPELVGKSAVYRAQISPCSYASYLIAIRFSPSVVPELAAAYINSGYGRQWVKSVVTQQVGQANVNGTKLAALAIPLPPIKEQTEILRLFAEQRALAAEQSANVAHALRQSAAQRKNILQAAFSGRLVPQDPNDEPASVLLARIRAERAASGATRVRRGRQAKT